MSSQVLSIRGVDRELYRRVKAVAALRGIKIGEAINEALRLWLSIRPVILAELGKIDEEARANRRAFAEVREKLLKSHEGRYVAVAGGRVLGVFDTLEEAARAVEGSEAKHGIVEKLSRERRERLKVELGWGLVEIQ